MENTNTNVGKTFIFYLSNLFFEFVFHFFRFYLTIDATTHNLWFWTTLNQLDINYPQKKKKQNINKPATIVFNCTAFSLPCLCINYLFFFLHLNSSSFVFHFWYLHFFFFNCIFMFLIFQYNYLFGCNLVYMVFGNSFCLDSKGWKQSIQGPFLPLWSMVAYFMF